MRFLSYQELGSEKGIRYSRSQLWRLERDNKFPQRVPITGSRIAWIKPKLTAGKMSGLRRAMQPHNEIFPYVHPTLGRASIFSAISFAQLIQGIELGHGGERTLPAAHALCDAVAASRVVGWDIDSELSRLDEATARGESPESIASKLVTVGTILNEAIGKGEIEADWQWWDNSDNKADM